MPQLPAATVRIARREVLETVLVPRLVVLQPNLLVLAHQRPLHARHRLQRRPLLQVAVARLQRELRRVVAALLVVQVQVHARNPLATIVLEQDRQVVVRARAVRNRVPVEQVRDVHRVAVHVRVLRAVVEHARVRRAHQTHRAVEVRRRLRRRLRHDRDRDRVRALLKVVY